MLPPVGQGVSRAWRACAIERCRFLHAKPFSALLVTLTIVFSCFLKPGTVVRFLTRVLLMPFFLAVLVLELLIYDSPFLKGYLYSTVRVQ